MTRPATPATRNTSCQFENQRMSHAITSGAITAPSDPPTVQRLLAVARCRFSNQSVTATSCPAKIVGSASPRMPRHTANCQTVCARPPPMQASDQTAMPASITRLGPNRSTRIPDTGYISA